MRKHPILGLISAAVASTALHGIAYGSLAFSPPPPRERPPSRVTLRVHEAPPPPQAKEVPPSPPPPVKPVTPERRQKANPEPEPAPPAPVDLSGVTLTNESGTGSFASIVGNGASFDGPLGPVSPRREAAPAAHAVPRASPAAAPATSFVPLGDLSEKPVPPALGAALRAHYPRAARERAVGGSATVKARVEPDGRIRSVTLVSETFEGFGDACRRTLLESRWSPPKDRDGRAVSTAIRYTCRFVVQP